MPGQPPVAGQIITANQHRVGIGATGDSYAVPLPKGVEPGAIAATDNILTSWRTFATSLGQTAPGHVNRAQRAIRGLGRFGG